MIYVVATSELKEGCREQFIEIAKANVPNVLAEEGCIMYQLNENFDSGLPAQNDLDPNTLTFVECWESQAHLDAHLATPHMARFRDQVTPLRISTKLQILQSV